MAPESSNGASVSVMEEEPLRPPESWPGAGGLKSVAPEVPSWPTGPITGLAPAAAPTPAPSAPKGTGEGWPGAEGGSVPSPQPSGVSQGGASASEAPRPEKTRSEKTRSEERRSEKASGNPAMGPSIGLLLACVAIAVWVLIDPDSRVLQASVLALVLIVGGVFVARTMRGNLRR